MSTKRSTVLLLGLVAYVLSAIARRRAGQHGSNEHLHGTPYQWPAVAQNATRGERVTEGGAKGPCATTA